MSSLLKMTERVPSELVWNNSKLKFERFPPPWLLPRLWKKNR
jgi:hypothetical protein